METYVGVLLLDMCWTAYEIIDKWRRRKTATGQKPTGVFVCVMLITNYVVKLSAARLETSLDVICLKNMLNCGKSICALLMFYS